ncbi:hypothetical protein [Pseudomonas fluorescens]|uniref:Uncharacterized protein n=1 Tax=Pseudomonas fluorescens TaxID=294 RepID=A0A944E4C4_PSEFL|nr:hypothetical protein [Pseudomonas fluorescens]MBT2294045.1 hypothetical protein [Pseudomonas fluorescens]MBT2307298.1 hypothetical protein [Pseudomonas fluorescens]MBT2311231.1 hypothetical protein [Pseudomonas fluorescens]MBT2319714.1 hypothetical protein [Pseudomonas fluorescens]MBT2332121.1 hypothetical protein [Pseudomonas fluorescens]
MMKSNVTALTLAGILSISSVAVFAQSTDGNPPVDKGGMPPSTEMEAGSNTGDNANALPPGSVQGGNGDDATGSGSMSGGSSMGGDASSSGTGAGTTDSSGGSGDGGSSGSSGSSQ